MRIMEKDEKQLFKTIGKNVKYYRRLYNYKKGSLTQEQLAKAINVSTALIGNLESDKVVQGIMIYNLWKISRVLDVPIEYFFTNNDKTKDDD